MRSTEQMQRASRSVDRAGVWLCDLTYTQQTISSDVMPAAVGCIAAFTDQYLGSAVETRIFKFPEKLAAAIENDPAPRIIGFSNYTWNADLSARFAEVIKRRKPGIVIVFGGPNYPTAKDEQEQFLRALPMVDFYIVKEGEVAFAKLTEALIANDFDVERISDSLPSLHRIDAQGQFLVSDTVERIWDLTQIPSPYLTGRMDEFFDGTMLPIIQTNRGCPFRCTFCIEGLSYYSRVAKSTHEKVEAEIFYIAKRMAALRDKARGRTDLHIADSNFGMYKEDIKVCESIAAVQRKYKYPEYISVATGKNHKKRVLEAARIVNGALRLSGSVQSLDRQVLENIDRGNINEEDLLDLALEASAIGANSYSELILALPGDSLEAHFTTIEKIVEADFNTICLYQLMLLPGTDLASAESIEKWRMVTRYRILPRSFGYFDCLGETINAAEIERICIANNSLTMADYIECRRFHLIINVFYNDGVFKEVLRLLKTLGLSKYEWLKRIFDYRDDAEFVRFTSDFLKETEDELWESHADLTEFIRHRENIESYILGELGANLIFKYRSIALIQHVDMLAKVAHTVLEEMLHEHDAAPALDLGVELIEFSRLRMSNIFENANTVCRGRFAYAMERFSDDVEPGEPESYKLDEMREYTFVLSAEQKQTLGNFLSIYGNSLAGLSRILSKVYVRRLFRMPTVGQVAVGEMSAQEAVIRDGQLTGLNEFA